MLGDVARSTANLMFMLIGIWMVHRLYQSDKAWWQVVLAWTLAFVFAGISATLLSSVIADEVLTHERISMFCGFCGIFVYIYLFPSVPLFQRIFTYFFVDTSMYFLVILSRFLSVFLYNRISIFTADGWFLCFYFSLAAAFVFLFIKHLREPMLRSLAVFYNQLKPLAFFAFLCYVTMLLFIDPWGALYTVSAQEVVGVCCAGMLTVCMYFIAFRTMDAINIMMSKELESKMLKVQIDLSERYYHNLMKSIERTKAIRHDLNHHIKVMEAMCTDERWVDLQAYMQGLYKEAPREKLPIYCQDYVGNALLDYYAGECSRLGIAFDCKAQLSRDAVKDKLKQCILLGNGLQNALEACERMIRSGRPTQGLYIDVQIRSCQGNLIIEIRNSFDGRVRIEAGKLKTVKKESDHGFGMDNIRSTVELYHGYCNTEFTDDEFVLSLLLNLEMQPEPEKTEKLEAEKD